LASDDTRESGAAIVKKVRWGVLGAARIAVRKVIPAMQRGRWSTVTAIASRDARGAEDAAAALGIASAYGSYDALLADPEVDGVYIPLPNHLHVPWTIRAAEAGKHVLCEKPIALNAAEAASLLDVRDRTGVLIQEAFMVRTAPQWLRAQAAVRDGRLGDLRAMSGFFSYFNEDPANVRHVAEYGGGALLDIGCYLVNTARMIFDREPGRVAAFIERDPRFGVDRLCSMMLDFGTAHAIGTCATQLAPYQRIQILGTQGRLEVDIPFNAPPDTPCRLRIQDGQDRADLKTEVIEIDTCDQYTVQGDLLSRAILDGTAAPYPLEDSVQNMRIIDALFGSAITGSVRLQPDHHR
jgi:predicted dehydrogenase